MVTNIYFVRHAHSTYTPDELGRPLSSRGLQDASKISDVLEKSSIDIIISSPYKRAIQTVEGIAKLCKREIIIDSGFKERVLSGSPVHDFNSAITRVWEEPTFCWEGGESNIIAQRRGINAVFKVLERYEGKSIALGTHGNIMVLIMNYFDTKYDFNFWKNLDMPDIYKLTFDGKNLKGVNRIWSRV